MSKNPFKEKNGRSFKTIAPGKDMKDDSGDAETHGPAHRATKGMKPGTGVKPTSKRQPASYMERNSMGQSFKTVVDEWCSGKRKSYKS
jgi:hypothetical protein